MAFDVKAAHEALAAKLRSSKIGETFDVFAYPQAGVNRPRVEIAPGIGGDWVSLYGTYGSAGRGDLFVTIRVWLTHFPTSEDRFLQACRLAGVGVDVDGNAQATSIADVIMTDRSLGGVVQDCVPLGPDGSIRWEVAEDGTNVLELGVLMILKKSGATV